MQLSLFDVSTVQTTTDRGLPQGWRRLHARGDKCGSRYRHESGWRVEHCGHPTALYSFELISPKGYAYLAPHGRNHTTIAKAFESVALVLSGKATARGSMIRVAS